MSSTIIRRCLLLLAASALAAFPMRAQTVKAISVSNDASFTDHISLAEDSRDMDIMVKFVFDEQHNRLTVSVLSYRSLFVFREPTRYSSAVKACGRLKPDLLPYVVAANDQDRFVLERRLIKSIPHPRKKYVFRRWIEYDGLQPAPSQYKMVNDYIEQTFDILQQRNTVTVTLRDLYLLERSPKKAGTYYLLKGRDLDVKYQIKIQRNPCLGMDEELSAAQKRAADIRGAWLTMKKNYGSAEVGSQEALKTFEDTRNMLITQFPRRQEQSVCPDVQQEIDRYNSYVDSISVFRCRVRAADPDDPGNAGLEVRVIYSQVRQLDKNISRYLVSKDNLEKSDLAALCRGIIEEVNAHIRKHPATTEEERKAVAVFRQAEQYFRKTCRK